MTRPGLVKTLVYGFLLPFLPPLSEPLLVIQSLSSNEAFERQRDPFRLVSSVYEVRPHAPSLTPRPSLLDKHRSLVLMDALMLLSQIAGEESKRNQIYVFFLG
ncbi:hypothetical protein EV361DRAFT_957169 [Lentinula raphanica]|nr:hypothetical protein EV361DRAFT_957169 [Lentinula raphanica]